MEVVERVKELIPSYLEENNIELVDITYKREQGGMTLRLLVDTPEGITIAECEALNNYLSEVLDKENAIEEHYLLEVSSPGLDRAITTDRDFARSIDKALDITTYEPIDGKRTLAGKLIGMDKDNIVIEADDVSTVIPKAKIAKAKLRIEFPRL
ncbi:MAG: ribosome maturation factor RimP [Candidatus Omnitrophica bacterium]|nr:ribosome maturation factor RimP [Candidatus Omnitrophota bacterium]